MSVQARLSGISFHLHDLDELFPKLVRELEELQQSVLNHEEGRLVEQKFQQVGLLAMQVFRREEEAMDLCRDEGAPAHRAAHRMFLGNLSKSRSRFQSEGPSMSLARDLRSEAVEWMVDHHKVLNACLGRVVLEMIVRSNRHNQAIDGDGSSSG